MSLDQPFFFWCDLHLCYREQIYLSQDSIDKVGVPKINYPTTTTLEAAALVVLFLQMLKSFPQKKFK
jgi:hypothetical protein